MVCSQQGLYHRGNLEKVQLNVQFCVKCANKTLGVTLGDVAVSRQMYLCWSAAFAAEQWSFLDQLPKYVEAQ